MQFHRAGDITIHFETEGFETGKPVVVFINSLGTDLRIWTQIRQLLGNDYAFVAWDKRGHGLSDIGTGPYHIDDHVDDLASLLDHLGIDNAIICGLSVGGLIAQGLYKSRPDLVQALILCDTAHKIGTADMWNGRIAAVENNGLASIVDPVMERWFTPAFRAPENAAFRGYCNMLVQQSDLGYAATCAAIRDADFTADAPKITVPVMCVVGDQDGSTPPALVSSLADLIPGSRFEIIDNAGHIPCVEQPVALAALLRDFITRLPASGDLHG